MVQMQGLKQMTQMNKMAFDNSFNMMMSAFEQNKLMLNTFLSSQPSSLPEEGKKATEEWLQNYKKGCEGLKKMVDEGYSMIDKYMTEGVQ